MPVLHPGESCWRSHFQTRGSQSLFRREVTTVHQPGLENTRDCLVVWKFVEWVVHLSVLVDPRPSPRGRNEDWKSSHAWTKATNLMCVYRSCTSTSPWVHQSLTQNHAYVSACWMTESCHSYCGLFKSRTRMKSPIMQRTDFTYRELHIDIR